jgi:hypothetical protein
MDAETASNLRIAGCVSCVGVFCTTRQRRSQRAIVSRSQDSTSREFALSVEIQFVYPIHEQRRIVVTPFKSTLASPSRCERQGQREGLLSSLAWVCNGSSAVRRYTAMIGGSPVYSGPSCFDGRCPPNLGTISNVHRDLHDCLSQAQLARYAQGDEDRSRQTPINGFDVASVSRGVGT